MSSIFLHLIRHAQGEHNVTHDSVFIKDPSLTLLGQQQCATLQSTFPLHPSITHLISSPMRRTIQTCLGGFRPAVDRGLKMQLLPKLQEFGPWPCDTGSEPEEITKEFGKLVDVSRVEKGWNDKKDPNSIYASNFDKIEERALAARRELQGIAREWKNREGEKEAHMVVVSHGAFMHFLTGCFYDIPKSATRWKNAAMRTFKFADSTLSDGRARLVETEESWKANFGNARRPTEEESKILKFAYKNLLSMYLDGSFLKKKI